MFPTVVTGKFGKCRVTIRATYTDSAEDGYTSEDDKTIGFGTFTIPAEYRQGFLEEFGEDHISKDQGVDLVNEWPEGSNFDGYNPDLFIYWANYIINHMKEFTLDVRTEDIFWPVHDFFHGVHDFHGNMFYCSATDELVRYRQAYAFLHRRGIKVETDYLRWLTDVFNKQKWGCYGSYMVARRPISVLTITRPKRIKEPAL